MDTGESAKWRVRRVLRRGLRRDPKRSAWTQDEVPEQRPLAAVLKDSKPVCGSLRSIIAWSCESVTLCDLVWYPRPDHASEASRRYMSGRTVVAALQTS